ncbi:hypothetical protein [Streptosporangium lutulentum]|uniref:SAM-dependent methyltransferase n=1 Tax=Streptosporangium lutulentum TaxID=1461250 RepID=A0ABT9QWH3_9ACTN|nr:hypothetical protein [Streptosporangium lutulentum]
MTAAHFDDRATRYAGADWHLRYAERLVELAELSDGHRVSAYDFKCRDKYR